LTALGDTQRRGFLAVVWVNEHRIDAQVSVAPPGFFSGGGQGAARIN